MGGLFSYRRIDSYYSLMAHVTKKPDSITVYANNKGAYQTAHLRSLVSAFVFRSVEVLFFLSVLYLYHSMTNRRHWHDTTGMRKFRIDQDFLIEHWHIIYIMPVVFAEIYF